MTIREIVYDLLKEQKYEQLLKVAKKYHTKTLKYIQMHLYEDVDKPLRWHAIEALGYLALHLAPKEPEKYKNLIRRFLWAMNDESGNVPWSSPEAIGSIIARQPFLFGEYTPMVITNGLDNPMCHRGVLWAFGKIGRVSPQLVEPFSSKLLPFLEAEDPNLCGYGAWAFGELKDHSTLPKLKELLHNQKPVIFFTQGNLTTTTVSQLAQGAVERLEASGM